MNTQGKASRNAASLKDRIQSVELSIDCRHERVRNIMSSMVGNARNQIVSPIMLVSAALCGVAIQRAHEFTGWRSLAILQTTTGGLRFLLGRMSRISGPMK